MFTLNCNGRLLVVDKPLVMGIINATPDSFYEGSRFSGTDKILLQAEKMIIEGADILDIGGQSTRPGSEQVSDDTELNRILESIEAIHQKFPETIISVDTLLFDSRKKVYSCRGKYCKRYQQWYDGQRNAVDHSCIESTLCFDAYEGHSSNDATAGKL